MTNEKTRRRKSALERLQTQLGKGTKTQKKSTKTIPLSEGDVKRIEKEIALLSK